MQIDALLAWCCCPCSKAWSFRGFMPGWGERQLGELGVRQNSTLFVSSLEKARHGSRMAEDTGTPGSHLFTMYTDFCLSRVMGLIFADLMGYQGMCPRLASSKPMVLPNLMPNSSLLRQVEICHALHAIMATRGNRTQTQTHKIQAL